MQTALTNLNISMNHNGTGVVYTARYGMPSFISTRCYGQIFRFVNANRIDKFKYFSESQWDRCRLYCKIWAVLVCFKLGAMVKYLDLSMQTVLANLNTSVSHNGIGIVYTARYGMPSFVSNPLLGLNILSMQTAL